MINFFVAKKTTMAEKDNNIFTFADADGFCLSDDFYNYDYTASPLCVPQDPIDEIELYPSFLNDSISLTGLDFLSELETPAPEELGTRVMMRKRVALLREAETSGGGGGNNGNGGFVGSKKQRTKREGRRPAAWSMKHDDECDEEEDTWWWRRQNEMKRMCSHCETTQTPQWRVGPMGPKTLCNACGVRYKSGRLLPEYRPVASPTFDSHVHSNFHRNIVKKKTSAMA